ncbi:MAG: hypothetical protein WCS43_03750 [Verrucomicrobiota bacterium]
MCKHSPKLTALIFFAAACGPLHATGDFGGPTMLGNGGSEVMGTPEFFWELECKRIALEFVPSEKRVAPSEPKADQGADSDTDKPSPDLREQLTAAMDLADFKAAIHDGSIKPNDPAAATAAHAAAREVLKHPTKDAKLPEESPGEFSDYHKAALIRTTKDDADAERAAWKALLARPAAERKYRSTWAAYMLGRCELDDHQYAKAAEYFQQTRQLAKNGFIDSLGLAAESYGWEARCELELGHSEASAKLYLTQLATGDPSAVISLKWFIPDWGASVKGEENAKPGVNTDPDSLLIDPGPRVETPRGAKALADAARSPLLRRLVCAHILASATPVDSIDSQYLEPAERGTSQTKWLAALNQAGINETPDAEYIAWVAYSAGKYQDAKHWLTKATQPSAASLWLQAKFALREGQIAQGTKLLSEALKIYPLPAATLENSIRWGYCRLPVGTANGELAIMRLAQSDFIQALDAFRTAGLWNDAAYIAERCLTKAELIDYANKNFKPDKKEGDDRQFRNLVARRMVREDDYKTAKEFFSPNLIKPLDEYTRALADGADATKSKRDQARALFHAAWIARYQGMQLMGTEVGPDNTAAEGAFNEGDLAMERLTGKKPVIEDIDAGEDSGMKEGALKFAFPVTKEEKQRLQASKLVVELRFHYRHVAAGLAWKAAALLPDHQDETADVLNAAGNWLKVKHEKQARRFAQAITKRCANTEIGKAISNKKWFIEKDGPWSEQERKLMPQE